MISIVIPLYNKEKLIANTLKTVLNQTFQDFEIVIVNDGSTDLSVTEVEKIKDSRIRIFHQKNAGVSAARNKGIHESRGEFIAFLDADDEWNPNYLYQQNELTKKYPLCDIFATNYEFKYSNGDILPTTLRRFTFDSVDGVMPNYFEIATYSHPPLWTSATMVRRSAILSVNGFPVGIKSGEDLLTWARLAIKFKIAYSFNVCAIYYLDEGYNMCNLPPRRQDKGDPVGKCLRAIYRENPDIVGLRKYISHWHKMRASTAIRYGEKLETLKEVFISLKYNLFNYKVLPFFILAFLPRSIRKYIFSKHQ